MFDINVAFASQTVPDLLKKKKMAEKKPCLAAPKQ